MKKIRYIFFIITYSYSLSLTAQIPSSGGNKSAYTAFRNAEKKFYKGNLSNGERTFYRSAQRYERNGNVDGYIAAKAMEGLTLLSQDKPKEAFKAFRYAEELFDAQARPNKATQAYLSLCIGKYHLYYKETAEAEGFLSIANRIMKENPSFVSPIFEAELQESLGDLYVQKGENAKADAFFAALKESIRKADALVGKETTVDNDINQKDTLLATDLVGLSDDEIEAIYDKRGAADEAADYYSNLLRDSNNLDTKRKTQIRFNSGKNSFKFTDYEAAYDELMRALNSGELSLEDEAKAKSMLATIAMSVRDYKDALKNNGDALRIQLEIGAPAGDLFNSFVKQGQICQSLDGIDNSVYWYKKTLKNIEDDWTVDKELEKYGLDKIVHVEDPTLNTSFSVALLNFKRAELLLDELPADEKILAEVQLLMAKGNLYYNAGYNRDAEEYYTKAQVIIEKYYPPNFNLLSETYRYLAAINARFKKLEIANDFANKALNAALKENKTLDENYLPKNFEDILYHYEMLYALVVKGNIVHQKNSKKATLENMKQPLLYSDYGAAIITELKKIHRHESAKYELSELTEDVNHQAIATTRVLYQLKPDRKYLSMIFNFMEQSKSSLLLQAIQQLRAQKIVDVPTFVIEKEHKLKTKISYYTSELHYESKLGESADEERIAELRKKLKSVQEEYPEYLDYIKQTHPKYYDLKYKAQVATLDDLQNNLIGTETFVNYIVTDSIIHMLVVEPDDILYVTSKKPSNFRNGIAKYIKAMKGDDPEDFLRYSNLLYQKIIKPAKEKMLGKSLIIIPDGVLNYIPFEVVPTEDVPQSWTKGDYSLYKEIPYLLRSSSVVYNYSATLFLEARAYQSTTLGNGFVGYAPDFTQIESFVLSHKHEKKKYEDLLLEPLENAAIEVAMIGELTEGKTWIGEVATETEFRKDAQQYGVVHFATHGILNNKFPLYSNLVMLGDGDNDGLLHTYELYNMQINAELVALSACNTGVGRIQKGEGAMSIARGFAYAGCPNIAMTLWPVSDQATQILMENFYKNMLLGESKAEALRKAKLHFIESGTGLITVPYFWSGMLIVGTPNELKALDLLPFYERRPLLFWSLIGGVILLLLAIVVVSVLRKRK